MLHFIFLVSTSWELGLHAYIYTLIPLYVVLGVDLRALKIWAPSKLSCICPLLMLLLYCFYFYFHIITWQDKMAFIIIKLYQLVFTFAYNRYLLIKLLLTDKGPCKLNYIYYLVGGGDSLIHPTTWNRGCEGMVLNLSTHFFSFFPLCFFVLQTFPFYCKQYILIVLYVPPTTPRSPLPPHELNSTRFLSHIL